MTLPGLALALLTSAAAAAAEPDTADSAQAEACTASSFFDCLVLSIGLGVSGDAYPLSSVNAAPTGKPQRSLMGSARFWIGTRLPNRFALRGVFDFGYVTVGPFPTRGTDGIFEAAGLELTLDTFRLVKPFIRFMYDAVVARISMIEGKPDDGVLKANAFFFQAGTWISIVDLHLAVGRDFAGGIAPGIGFSVAWLN